MEYLSEFASDFARGFGPIDSDVIGGLMKVTVIIKP